MLETKVLNTNEIRAFVHCQKCLEEVIEKRERGELISPREYAQLEVGFTVPGLQVWCKRHEVNVMHVDFEGVKHPANTTI